MVSETKNAINWSVCIAPSEPDCVTLPELVQKQKHKQRKQQHESRQPGHVDRDTHGWAGQGPSEARNAHTDRENQSTQK